MEKTIGGDRLGSGQKMKTHLHNFERSSHNLSYSWRSSMAPGALVPFMCFPAVNGDTFDIDLDAMARTIPTIGPLFGSFKLQLDVFSAPVRLYNGKLHNNPLNVGMNMAGIKFPKVNITTKWKPYNENTPMDLSQIAPNSLVKYLGISGCGRCASTQQSEATVTRKFNATPILAYYDIFKNYYANKQEENAYVITAKNIETEPAAIYQIISNMPDGQKEIAAEDEGLTAYIGNIVIIYGNHLSKQNTKIKYTTATSTTTYEETLEDAEKEGYIAISNIENDIITFIIKKTDGIYFTIETNNNTTTTSELNLESFPLENIDEMRNTILECTNISEFVLNTNWEAEHQDELPYAAIYRQTTEGYTYNMFPMNGLCVKTYQSDIFNNWVNTDWIDGENGIAAITAVDTSSGSFNIDTLNLAQKVYNMLNRIAISGGTYEDWQEAVYGEEAMRRAESPIYCGGMSSEIVFEEVISTAESTSTADTANRLGSLAGKGTLNGKRSGNLTIKVREPSFIIGIVSITPRIDYTQGNEWYMTELDAIDDLHKPSLDGIGFQNLMNEQMAWWDTIIQPNGSSIIHRGSAGKLPAWMNYMTNVDKAYGDFADSNKTQYMILARNYGYDAASGITDLTTYIDPSKYNYAFAYTKLDAQNFWIQIYSKITARRKMSAKVIPNL